MSRSLALVTLLLAACGDDASTTTGDGGHDGPGGIDARPAPNDRLIGAQQTGVSTANLIRIDEATGGFEVIGAIPDAQTKFAFDGTNLFALSSVAIGTPQIGKVDPCSGGFTDAHTLTAPGNVAFRIGGFASHANVLYATVSLDGDDLAYESFMSIDPTTGSMSVIGTFTGDPSTTGSMSELFDLGGMLFGAHTISHVTTTYPLNATTGALASTTPTLTVQADFAAQTVGAYPNTISAWVVTKPDTLTGHLIELDATTGAIRDIGFTSADYISTLARVPFCR